VTVSNVLLITIDSLRADYQELINIEVDPLAIMNECLDETVEFSQAIANGPNTPSSFPTILTSTHPMMYGGYRYLDERRPFVAETFRKAGYDTVAYHSNPHLGKDHNYQTGFKIFNDSAEGSDTVAGLKNRVEDRLDPDSRLYSMLRRLWHWFTMSTGTAAYAKAETITENALRWFETEHDGDPFFMWLHYMDVHYPFQPPDEAMDDIGFDQLSTRRVAELNGKMQEDADSLTEADVADLLKLYVGEIKAIDQQIDRLFDLLEVKNLLSETVVIVTADHGEAFGEHGRFGHHPYLYDELLRVPLIVHAPGLESRTIDQQVSLLDIGPTLYDLLDIETPDAVQGISLTPLLYGKKLNQEVAIATGNGGGTLACRTSGWKCFWQVEENEVELYDLQEDPDELNDVSIDHPDIVTEFREQMETYLEAAEGTDIDLPDIETNTEVEQRLRDLGYR
jgi:arylsulfatase A-like enzyme